MTTLFVGDVHGCADELAQLVNQTQPTRVMLVGDLFTKGPDPTGVWQQVRDGGFKAVLGNHDARLLAPRKGDKHAAAVIAALNAFDSGWHEYVGKLPLYERFAGQLVVHAGVLPSGLQATMPHQLMNLRRLPPADPQALLDALATGANVPPGPFWWESYQGPEHIVYGHDAKRGLVRRPFSLGLDTGCVYGGSLTGWVVESDELVQIPAKRAYRAIV